MFRRTKTKFEKKDTDPTDDGDQKSAKNEIAAGLGKFLGKKKNQESGSKSSKSDQSNSISSSVKNTEIIETSKNTDKITSLIRLIKSSKEKILAPQLDLSTGVFSFPQLAEIGEDPNNIEFLENLATDSADLLEKIVYERIAVCPQHPDSLEINVRLYCPKCSSMDIEKLHLFEHRVCGYIAETKNFGITNALLECPSCKKPIKDKQKELRIPAMWYNCHSCKEKFDDVVIKMFCRKFNHDFDTNMAGTVSIPGFILNDSQLASGHDTSLLYNIKNLLEEHKFIAEEDQSLKGKSGHYHNIDIIATNPNTDTIFLYVLESEKQIDESEINSKIIQVLDCNPTKTIIIGNLSNRSKALAARYDISVIDSFENDKVLSSLTNIINETFTTEELENESPKFTEFTQNEIDEEKISKIEKSSEDDEADLRRKLGQERLSERKKLEEERLESERIEAERLEAELLAEKQRLEKEMQESKQKLEGEVLADKQRLEEERERLEEERRESERLEAERLAERKRLEEERKKVERIEAERLAERKKLESEILAERKRIEAERIAERKKLEEERFADQLKLKAEQQRLEKERKRVEELEAERERLEEERKRAELLAAEKLAAEEKRKEEERKQAVKRSQILKKLEETENQLRSLKSSFDSDDESGE